MEVMGQDTKVKNETLQWTNSFHPAEIIIHYKWNRTNVRDNHNTRYLRKGEPNRIFLASTGALDVGILDLRQSVYFMQWSTQNGSKRVPAAFISRESSRESTQRALKKASVKRSFIWRRSHAL